jgi:hypothetical protein
MITTSREFAAAFPRPRVVAFASALLFAAACAPGTTPAPAPAPEPVAAATPAAPTIMQTCPESSDGPSIIVGAVEDAHAALSANPGTPLPPACVLVAFGDVHGAVPDSISAHALAIATELDRRGTASKDLFTSQVVLLSRARRFADASRAYARLVAVEPQPPMDVAKLGLTAAREQGDTATLIRMLGTLATRPGAPQAFRTERSVVTQAKALREAIVEARGIVRQNPKYLMGYPSLVGNFGTLGWADSVASYARRALAQGATRASLTPALGTYVNSALRHSLLYGSAYGWETPIRNAKTVDAALSTPSTKFLVASLIVQGADPQLADAGALIKGASWRPLSSGAAAQAQAAQNRAAGCQRLPAIAESLDVAAAQLRAGGDKYPGGGVDQIVGGLNAERARISELQQICPRQP